MLLFASVERKEMFKPLLYGFGSSVSRSSRGPHVRRICYLLDGKSKGAWLNRSSIIYAGKDKWSGDPRVSIIESVGEKHEYSLQIQKVDITDDGLYTCSIQSKSIMQSKHVQLIVRVPPKIYDISSDITVNEGSNISLICTATGKPEPIISWRHITPLAKKQENGEYLNITGITRDQAGDYECGAGNDVASPDTKTVRVTVNFPPTIHEMKSHGVGLGRTALLRCEAAAVPTPDFEWYKGEKRLYRGQGIDIKNLSSRSVLTVTNMTEDRYGNYTCVAINRLGTANASVPLLLIHQLSVIADSLPVCGVPAELSSCLSIRRHKKAVIEPTTIIEPTTSSPVSSPGQYAVPTLEAPQQGVPFVVYLFTNCSVSADCSSRCRSAPGLLLLPLLLLLLLLPRAVRMKGRKYDDIAAALSFCYAAYCSSSPPDLGPVAWVPTSLSRDGGGDN
ncbi:hypothetical protein ACEWY4_014793 [Coilia grayii]|uniref:Neuronal growth regulator 1 n=1 Tax=Coilia grayii TaxID=363190 RepID=A0ABD1JTD0_9TELE